MHFISLHPSHLPPEYISLLKVNKVFFQYSDAGQWKGLLVAPLSQGGGASWCHITSCHVELFTFSWQCSEHCLFITNGTIHEKRFRFHRPVMANLLRLKVQKHHKSHLQAPKASSIYHVSRKFRHNSIHIRHPEIGFVFFHMDSNYSISLFHGSLTIKVSLLNEGFSCRAKYNIPFLNKYWHFRQPDWQFQAVCASQSAVSHPEFKGLVANKICLISWVKQYVGGRHFKAGLSLSLQVVLFIAAFTAVKAIMVSKLQSIHPTIWQPTNMFRPIR